MRIESYQFGQIRIDGRTYRSDVIVWPEGVDDTWWRAEGHSLCPEDLEAVFVRQPQALVIGTGALGALAVPSETQAYMGARCAEVYVEQTGRAVQLYNELTAAGRRAVAALHLTC